MKTFLTPALLVCASLAQLPAATIINNYNNTLGTGHDLQSAAVAFNLSVGYVAVSVSARLFTATGGGEFGLGQGTAYLLDNLGPGTTPNILYQNNFLTDFLNPGDTIAPSIGLFSDIELGPGNYYLVLQANPNNSNPMIWQTTPNGPVLGNGVTSLFNFVAAGENAPFNSQFFPVDTIDKLQYNVQGREANDSVPEPGTWALLAAGLGAIVLYKRAR